jgi:hypothetical protein
MTKSALGWIGLCLLFWPGMAADIPYVFNESPSGLADYSSDQLENISASSPELAGVPPISGHLIMRYWCFPAIEMLPAARYTRR